MKIIIAETAGFCMGVHRAVDLAVETSSSNTEKVYTLGPLIHNKQTIEMLHARGVTQLDESAPIPAGSTILIRAHGIPPKKQKIVESQEVLVVDGTCPKVKTVHRVITRYKNQGYQIIITGDKGHAEVFGLMGYAGDKGHLIQSIKDVEKLHKMKKICLVSQTTFNMKTFDDISIALKKKYTNSEIVIRKTICSATDKRQSETDKLAKEVDALIVVGGKNSANTIRLAAISSQSGTPTQHIEDENEINWEKIADAKTIGITAGASTPKWMIKRIYDHLHYLDRIHRKAPLNLFSQFLEFITNMNLFVATGGVAMYLLSSIFQKMPYSLLGCSMIFLYLFSMYLWNTLSCLEENKHLDISRYRFYRKNKRILTTLTLTTIATILILSVLSSKQLFIFMLFPTIAGVIYNLSIIPSSLQKILRYKNLKDIPASRDLFTALAWAIIVTFLPSITSTAMFTFQATIPIFIWTFFLAFIRSIIFDLRDIEGDRIMGRETLITLIGENTSRKLIFSVILMAFLTLILYSVILLIPILPLIKPNISPFFFILQMPVILHLSVFMNMHHRFSNTMSPLFNLLVDGQFYIAMAGGFIAMTFL